MEKNYVYRILPVSDVVILPGISHSFKLENFSEEAIDYFGKEGSRGIALILRGSPERSPRSFEDFHKIGATFEVTQVQILEDGINLTVNLEERVELKAVKALEDGLYGDVITSPDLMDVDERSKGELLDYIKNIVKDMSRNFKGSEPYVNYIMGIDELNKLISHLSRFLQLSSDDKYELLEMESIKERSLRFIDYMLKQKESLRLQIEMAERFSEKQNKNYREAVLREQLKAIKEELNEGGEGSSRKDKDYNTLIQNAGMPPEIEEVAYEEFGKLEDQSPTSSDYNVIRNYLDLLVALPWKQSELSEIDLKEARRILEEQHYGLDKVKERILQHLAVMKLKKDKKGSILLLVGPPGTGKTSLGRSISEALGRKYIRLSLGGIRDEAEIRGHRRTYVGAMPGRILQSIKKAGSKNPVMILDEVDKLMTGYNGDPASALLEVLDPEQNNTFTDHYLDLPYDLSEVFFIATANSLDNIPGPLLDRMEVIQISSYTGEEKFHIARRHLLPEVIEEHGLTPDQLQLSDDIIKRVITEYTMEAGVRGLKKQLAAIARVMSEKLVSGSGEPPFLIKPEQLDDILGRKVSRHDRAEENNPPGVVTGLAWTPVGGEILFIEATDMTGSGQVIMTGKLGEVMQESAKISLSLLKSRLPINTINFKEKDIHIHVPSGAVPKDGPSAGIALFTALASLVTGIKVDSKLAMTGEITLRGAVLPIGGLKEKLLGAERSGIRRVLIPKENEVDLKDVPEEVLKKLEVKSVETIEDVMRECLGITLPRAEQVVKPVVTFGISLDKNDR